MEDLNVTPTTNTEENEDSTPILERLNEGLNKKTDRRTFLKGLGLFIAAGTLASCAPKGSLEAKEKDIYNENARELNRQYDEIKDNFLRPDGFFNYQKYVEQYPGFENYKEYIESSAIEVSRGSGIHPNVLRTLGTVIVASNIENQDPIKQGDLYSQRVGVMQFIPINVIKKFRERIDEDFVDSVNNMNNPENNIKYGLTYLVQCLSDFKNDGDNKDVMQLLLAYYYGQDNLVDQVKWNREITEDNYLWSNYLKYANTLSVLDNTYEEKVVDFENLNMEKVWNRIEELWSGSRFKENKDVFFKEAKSYAEDDANKRLNFKEEQYLALFASIARAESKGGLNLYNEESGASGWFQLVPGAKHLEDYYKYTKAEVFWEYFEETGEKISYDTLRLSEDEGGRDDLNVFLEDDYKYTKAEKLWEYFEETGEKYSYDTLRLSEDEGGRDDLNIPPGIWALMRYKDVIDELKEAVPRYKNDPDFHVLLKFFKAGKYFDKNRDDALWWNRVSYGLKQLLGEDPLQMGYKDYYAPEKYISEGKEYYVWQGPFPKENFENSEHIGLMKKDPEKEA
jgi:hypothetical protein